MTEYGHRRDERSASYLLTVMSAVYALLLDRIGVRQPAQIFPLEVVFPEE